MFLLSADLGEDEYNMKLSNAPIIYLEKYPTCNRPLSVYVVLSCFLYVSLCNSILAYASVYSFNYL